MKGEGSEDLVLNVHMCRRTFVVIWHRGLVSLLHSPSCGVLYECNVALEWVVPFRFERFPLSWFVIDILL